jgi:hypothetical protein
MPAIASLEDLKAAQRDLRSMFLAVFPFRLTPYDLRLRARYALCALLYALRKWRRIGWKNILNYGWRNGLLDN